MSSDAASVAPLVGKRILVTGVTGWVAGPLARSLAAAGNEVFGAARLRDESQVEALVADGVTPVRIDLARRDLEAIHSEGTQQRPFRLRPGLIEKVFPVRCHFSFTPLGNPTQ